MGTHCSHSDLTTPALTAWSPVLNVRSSDSVSCHPSEEEELVLVCTGKVDWLVRVLRSTHSDV